MKDSLIQLAENGWLFVLDTEERNIFKTLYMRLKETDSSSALFPNRDWSKVAEMSQGSLIKYRKNLINYGLIVQIKEGGSYKGDANAWGIPDVLPKASISDWQDLIQNLDTIDDNIYKFIYSGQELNQNLKEDDLDKQKLISQIKNNLKRNPIFNSDDIDSAVNTLINRKYSLEVLLEISEFLLETGYHEKIDKPVGFIITSIQNREKYFKTQIERKQNIAFLQERKTQQEETKFNFHSYGENIVVEDTIIEDDGLLGQAF